MISARSAIPASLGPASADAGRRSLPTPDVPPPRPRPLRASPGHASCAASPRLPLVAQERPNL
ncbi:unnamed protein product [Urochloa humidicola]